MTDHRPGVKTLLPLLFTFLLLSGTRLQAQDGQALFQQNCASCHAVNKELTGPALAGVETRGPWTDRKQLYAWIHNPAKYMANDPYAQGLKASHGNVLMTAFPQLSEKEIDAILDYIKKTPPPAAGGGANGAPAPENPVQ